MLARRVLQNRLTRSGFYLMDEPEAALSPQRQLSFLVLLHDLVAKNDNTQFLIATHSPILLAYPDAQIFSFDGGEVHQISYRETQPFRLVSSFVAPPSTYSRFIFRPNPQIVLEGLFSAKPIQRTAVRDEQS